MDQKNFDAFADYLLRGSVWGIVYAITRWSLTLGAIGAGIMLTFQAAFFVLFRTPIDLWVPGQLMLTMGVMGIFSGLLVTGIMRVFVRRDRREGAETPADEAPAE